MKKERKMPLLLLVGCVFAACSGSADGSRAEAHQWITYPGGSGGGKGKNIVLVSGDEEYRSEEALPMLARILAKRHGFSCTVLFAIDSLTGEIDPNERSNIPGLSALETADLMLIFTRFRELPPDQMRYIDAYLRAGKPVVGLRTATHAFHYSENPNDIYAHYDFRSEESGWERGFGKIVLGETWAGHHGIHGKEGTRAVRGGSGTGRPILNGVTDVWVPTDVYSVSLPPQVDVLLYGHSTRGMTADAPINTEKEALPVAWTRNYTVPGGKTGKAFATTMGASIDLLNEDLRRLLVNACFWAVGLERQIPDRADVGLVSPYEPTMFGFDGFQKGKLPKDFNAE